jgi:hypothetical protein
MGQSYGRIDPVTGHDYTRMDNDTAPIDEPQVHQILKRRLQCKMSRQFQEADALRDQLSAMGVMVHDREKTWEVKAGSGGGGGGGANYGSNNYGAPPAQPTYAGKPPSDYYQPTGQTGFGSAPAQSLDQMATDAQRRIAAAQAAAAQASAGVPPTVAPAGATPYPPPPLKAAPARGRSNSDSSSSSSSRSRSRSRERKPGAIPRKGDAAAPAAAPADDEEKKAE